MTWFAWRVQRLQFLAAVVVVVGFAVWLTSVGLHEQARWTFFTQRGCTGALRYHSILCEGFDSYNFTHWNPYFDGILFGLPGLVGLLFGAPVVAREIEHGTNRFAWAQSITRTRWFVIKLSVGGVATVAIAAALAALGHWWTATVRAGSDVLPGNFDITGIVVVGYALFAFTLGSSLGALLRRTGWAILAGAPLFVAFRLLVRFELRSHLAPVLSASVVSTETNASPLAPLRPNGTVPQAWVIHSGYLPVGRLSPPPGRTWTSWSDVVQTCYYRAFSALPEGGRVLDDPEKATEHCAVVHKLHFVVQYQPLSHYWLLQTAETAVFVGFAALLMGVTVVAVRRWRS